MNWHIGQDIVAVRDHSEGGFKEGDTFVIKGLRGSSCKCPKMEIDVGIKEPLISRHVCRVCGYKGQYEPPNSIWWFGENNFAPLDTLCDISELTEVLERPIFS